MKKLIILFVSAFILLSCNQQGRKATQTDSSQKDTIRFEQVTNKFDVAFPENVSTVTLLGNLKSVTDSQIYIFEAKKGQKLSAKITPRPKPANIRFSTIVSPSGVSDGPFGIEMTYDINENGKWQLTVGESNMNGENWVGDYELNFTLK